MAFVMGACGVICAPIGVGISPLDSNPHMHKYILAVALAVSTFVSASFAQSNISIDSTPAEIRDTQDALKLSLEKKQGDYKNYSDDDRNAILHQQKSVYAIIEGKTGIDQLDETEKVALVNALESIKALLANADDNRMICERVKVIGSNLPKNQCLSVGQRRKMREAIQRDGLKTTN